MLFAAVASSLSSGPQVEWIKTVTPAPPAWRPTGTGAYAVATDSSGNFYVGCGPDTCLVKLNSLGEQIWTFGLPLEQDGGRLRISGLHVDGSDNVLVSGDLYGHFALPGLSHDRGNVSQFWGRFTPGGKLAAANIFTNLYAESQPLAVLPTQTFFVAGRFNRFVQYGDITLSSFNSSSAIFKIDPDGSCAWARRVSGDKEDSLDGVTALPTGEALVTGTYFSSVWTVGNMTITNAAAKSLSLFSLDSSGLPKWAKTIKSGVDPGGFTEAASAVAHSPWNNSILWAGDFVETAMLDALQLTSSGKKDVFLASMSASGKVRWARRFGGLDHQYATCLAVDLSGNIFVGGFFTNQIALESTSLQSRGEHDLFIAKFSSDGMPIWLKSIGSVGNERKMAIGFAKDGGLVVVGELANSIVLDGHILTITNSAGFIAKFSREGAAPTIIEHPGPITASAGTSVTLRAEAQSSDGPVHYQWWFNGAQMANQTNAFLEILNMQAKHAGSYYVVVKNSFGEVRSDIAPLTFTDTPGLEIGVHASLTIFGTVGRDYRIEYSTSPGDSANWTLAAEIKLSSTPQVWTDPTPTGDQRRFYRALLKQAPLR